MLTLRPYQSDCLSNLARDYQKHKALLIVMATGTGKTITFLEWLNRQAAGRSLIIAHRKELVDQPRDKMVQFFPSMYLRSGIVMADQNNADADIICATIQTLNANGRLDKILAHGSITHVVVDEAHHRVASTYVNVLDWLREANPDLLELGVTATPERTDKDGLVRVYKRCSYNLPIKAAIRKGALVPFDALGIGVPISLVGIRETSEGWDREPLGDILSADNVLEIVFDKWRELCSDRQTIGFTASVAQAHATAEYFRAHGVKAESADGTTHKKERSAILERYQTGETQVIFNCMLWIEGFDAPETGAVMMIAPTKSDLVYVQRLGRGLRIAPGKKTCRVLDFAPLAGRNIITAGDVLGKSLKIKKAEEKAEAAGVLTSINVDLLGRAVTIDPDSLIIEVLDLMARSPLPWALDEIYATATLAEKCAAALVLPDPRRLETAESMRGGDNWNDKAEALYQYLKRVRLYRVTKDRSWSAELVGTYDDLDDAKDEVGDWQTDGLGNRRSSWRKNAASEKQINYLMRLVSDVPEGPTMGEASRMISQALTIKAVKVAERRQELAVMNAARFKHGETP